MKVWSLKVADTQMGNWIKKRDDFRCFFCKRRAPEVIIDCSHFWGRYAKSTRFHPDNLDAVCRGCHFKHENAKQGVYRERKMQQLGPERYADLRRRYYRGGISERDAIIWTMKFLAVNKQAP